MTVLDVPPATVRRVKRWSKREYNRMIDRDVFGKQRLLLLRGEVIEMPAIGHLHVVGTSRALVYLVRTFDPDYCVRDRSPFEVPGETIPQPDAAVVTHEQMARRPQANEAVLVIEVSDSSVELDRDMAVEYAAARVPDYWLQNMRDREVEVYRDPTPDPASPTGWRYASHRIYHEGESIAPLAKPEAVVAVSVLVRTPP